MTQLKLFLHIILSLCYKLKAHFKLELAKLLTVRYLRHYYPSTCKQVNPCFLGPCFTAL